MSEFEQTQNLRKMFLRSAYDLGKNRPGRTVGLDEIGGVMQQYMDTSTPEFVDSLTDTARFLDEKGRINKQTTSYEIINITSDGIDEVEGNKPPDTGATFQFYGDVQGSVIGTHNTAELTNNFDFRSIEQRIEREGGKDAGELKEALEEVRNLLERGDKLDRGGLSRFGEVMQRNSWFSGAVMNALLGFATQATG